MAGFTFHGGIHPFEGKELSKINHPDEGAFMDFDDLADPAVEGF